MSRTLRLGSRSSALARVQAQQVGDALRALDPSLRIDYRFIETSGDRSPEPNAALVTARGGFTEDLGRLLDQGDIDLAVHSWKDLPLDLRAGSSVVATLPRADARDVLLIRRDSLAIATEKGLTILSSSARRRHHLEDFLSWALPIKLPQVFFQPIRGDIATRLGKLLRGDGDGLVIAKAAIDRLLEASLDKTPHLLNAQNVVRRTLLACRALVLPLQYCPAAPGQGALAIEIPNNSRFRTLLSRINHDDTFELVSAERQQAAQFDPQEPLGLTRLRFDFGIVEFLRAGDSATTLPRKRLLRTGQTLPKPSSPNEIWCSDHAAAATQRTLLLSAPQRYDSTTGLLVARSEALTENSQVDANTIIWTPGLTTWRKLAARGYWVVGSDESLGETGAEPIRHWFPQTSRWLKLTHERGYPQANSQMVPVYRRQRDSRLADVGTCTHFFWSSGSQLQEYLAAFPRLSQAWHGCGPGNTWRIARDLLDPLRLAPYLDADQFRAELLA